MRRLLPALALCFVFGCQNVPAKVADSASLVAANTATLTTNYCAVLDGVAKLDTDTRTAVLGVVVPAHDRALGTATVALSGEVAKWAQARRKE